MLSFRCCKETAITDTTLTYLDGYCERLSHPGLWAEPVNLVSNAAFLVAACIVWRAYRRQALPLRATADIGLLIITLAAIGLGSALWHLSPGPRTLLGDVLPILFFINLYLVSFLRRMLHCRWWLVFILWSAFQGLTVLFETSFPRDLLNGTIMYVPTYLTLAAMTTALFVKRHAAARAFLAILGLWTLSLAFRTADMAWCEAMPAGTHFVWHLLNAGVLGMLVRQLVPHSPSALRAEKGTRSAQRV